MKKIISIGLFALMGCLAACGKADSEVEHIATTSEELVAEETETTEEVDEKVNVDNLEEVVTETDSFESTSEEVDTTDVTTTSAEVSDEENNDYYFVCTGKSKTEVENFASEVKQQILDGDWSGLSEKISYPITIAGVEYADAARFTAADWNTIMSSGFLTAIETETCQDMFCNYEGIMLGNGQVWIAEVLETDSASTGELKITAINVQ